MEKITMYPTSVSQPNRDKSSGLQGKCFKAVRRNGTSYTISCRDQQDPKYHHEWSNAEEILKGKTIQCGRPSTHMCSHETYYGIAGYRNTCPIAGVTGTYTQPATLKVKFNLKKKGINSNATIEEVKISFDHRCTGVDVGNGKESFDWGPNFSGGKIYPNHKALKVKLGGKTKILEKNPPLSKNFGSTGEFVFKNVTYQDLLNGAEIIYGNNLETNPGNIYVKNLKATISYTDALPYISGKQDKDYLYLSTVEDCRTKIKFTLKAGYKSGNKVVDPSKAPKIIKPEDILCTTENKSLITVTYSRPTPNDNQTIIATLKDTTEKEGEKSVIFRIKDTKNKILFNYTAKKRARPDISIPSVVERNTQKTNIDGIIAKGGCATIIQAYKGSASTTPIYEFKKANNSFDITNKENIIVKEERNKFYKVLSTLPCGTHKILFRVNNEDFKYMTFKFVQVVPTNYNFKITEVDSDVDIGYNYSIIQNKNENHNLKIKYIERTDIIEPPTFIIKNSTKGYIPDGQTQPTPQLIEDKEWNTSDGNETEMTVGTYYPGRFKINITESVCPESSKVLNVEVTPRHRQYYDEIFVRGDDSTAFDYEYLVALEGDTIVEPIYVQTVQLGASYKDVKVCTSPLNTTGLGEITTFDFLVTNTSERDIKNLFLELNPLKMNEEENLYEVTSNEWLEHNGMFYNFKSNFEYFNSDYNDYVQIKNLTNDNDEVDEEDVYIHILTLEAGKTVKLKIPFGGPKERDVQMQILLFGQPMKLYNISNCNDETSCFTSIETRVYDSMLTKMNITGEMDLFENNITANCPEEYFSTELTYYIKNMDTIRAEGLLETVIENDPRLLPVSIKYKNQTYNLNNLPNNIVIDRNNNAYKNPLPILDGEKISLYTKFPGYDEEVLYSYTGSNGEATFFVTIPKTMEGVFTTESILEYCSIEFDGNNIYNGAILQKFEQNGNTKYPGEIRGKTVYNRKDSVKLTAIETPIKYYAGQTIPIRVQLKGLLTYMKNNIIFYPNINSPKTFDEVTVKYKIVNLDNNEGKLKTIFKTNSYKLIPNKEERTIYCGMNTNLILSTQIKKIILENRTINRLYISLDNKDRNNKNVIVKIKEKDPIQKYALESYTIDAGNITKEEEEITQENGIKTKILQDIIWNIPYIEEDSLINGYLDFEATHVGFSNLEVSVVDFIHNQDGSPKYKFGKESYKCPECRGVN